MDSSGSVSTTHVDNRFVSYFMVTSIFTICCIVVVISIYVSVVLRLVPSCVSVVFSDLTL